VKWHDWCLIVVIPETFPHLTRIREDLNKTMTVNVQELKRISFDLISGGVRDDLGPDLSRKIIVFNAFSLIGILNLVLLGTLAYFQKNPWLAALDYCAAVILAFLIGYLRTTKDYKTAFYGSVIIVGVLYYYLLFTGGVNNTAHVWYFTYPLIASFILGSRPGLAATLMMLVPAFAFFMWENPPLPFTTYSRDFKLRFIPSFLVITAFAYFFERTREKATMKLEGVNVELKNAVSALQDTEEKLRKAGEQLEQRVEERTAQLYRANLQLAAEMEERKRSEEALRASEGKLNAMLRSVGDSMIMIDRDLNVVWFNEKARESFALGRDGAKCHEMLCNLQWPCEPYPCYALQTFRDGEIHSSDSTLTTRHGKEGFYHCVANVALRDANGNATAVLTILRDITDRKSAENALMESEKKYRTLFEDSVEAMSVSRDGRMIDVNPAWLSLHGYRDKGEVLGRDVMEFIHPDDRHILVERRQTWPNHDFRSYQIRDIRRDGDIVDIEICASRIALAGQEAILTTIRDITEKTRSDREKKALEERLTRSEKMEAIGTLAGGVAHDLNNILGGIVGYPDLLLMELPEDSPLRRGILTIKNSGEKAAAIVQDLLTLARRGVPVMEPVNMNRIVTDYLRSPEFQKLRSFHPAVKIDSDLAGDLLPIRGSSVHLSKVVMNLVSNAAEAMPCGGTIRIETANQYVDTTIRGYDQVTEGEYIVMKVSDTGIGIAQKDIKKIFEPFYTKKMMGRSGTGLGMAVVWGTVKDHKGYIDIESAEGKGTMFTLYFPVNRAAAKAEDQQVPIEQFLSKGETILVVDDVAEQRELASAMLRKLGYSTETLASGEEAVEYLKNKPASLVILDMIMDPGIDGLETYRKITRHRPGQKAIIVSGFAETDRVKEAQKLGAGQYLKKPYTLEKIAVAVRGELDKAA
jgi:PAS domain S-box-containing protein